MRSPISTFETGVRAHLRTLVHARELRPLWRGAGLASSRYVVAMLVRDEALRLPHVMQHYRRMGVDHFLVVDNGSVDGTVDLLREARDTTVYQADGSFRAAHYGIDWMNLLLSRHCSGKWVVHVDADEYLVWQAGDRLWLPDLCRALEAEGRASLQAVMVDMYSEGPASENLIAPHQDPLEVTALFDGDPEGYLRVYDARMRGTWIKGGVRGRHFFSEDLRTGPALNKTPLVRWRPHHAFVQVAHELWPRSLNGGGDEPALALLHFKFTSFSTAKIADATIRAQHTAEYRAYSDIDGRVLVGEATRRYTGPADLVEAGLIRPAPELSRPA